ncbi:tripartite tricarboxylate transporter TctB family protein [Wenxinia marina]|uniref:Tripartite tricarboxylate transporter TctB family n=1 Tax=Wenxinia marina DSM 24838 TaxID=1123501 RepID=A0A0D0Q7K4_9RHOB|nr:tripartite tricarboxylate transporter TctB family protein [Wenxinia marina]KIQ68442.1 Tripartite tricarboxylate transporter TctB family [Wenxinia marina DSM 24838]GGL72242.1 hypothetical protein GCM10011392_28470 [Wenxinia marina]
MKRDWPDIWGGLALALVGLAAAGWAWVHYDPGTLRRMGPGAFPLGLGLALAGLGAAIAVPALRRAGAPVKPEPWAAACVLAAILVFGLGLRPLGLVLATASAVLISTLPAPRPGAVWRLVLAALVTALTVVLFHVGLQMTLPLWPRL